MTGLSTPIERLVLVREVEEFLFLEARLLDERRFDDWMALFTDDAVYWVPARPNQQSPFEELSIYYEDRALMDVRIRRLQHADTLAQIPPSRTRHVVGATPEAPTLEAACGGRVCTTEHVCAETDLEAVFNRSSLMR